MSRKICIDCRQRPVSETALGLSLCDPCGEYAEWENTHSDGCHEVYQTEDQIQQNRQDFGDTHVDVKLDEMIACPVCHPELDPRNTELYVPTPRPAQRGNQNAAGKQESHKLCGHPLTKSARQKCRTERRKIDVCPVCNASGDEKCKTRSGGRYKGKGGRHPQRDGN